MATKTFPYAVIMDGKFIPANTPIEVKKADDKKADDKKADDKKADDKKAGSQKAGEKSDKTGTDEA